MIRKVTLAVALAVGSLPFSAFGLGLGNITTHSALNQEFKADIQLFSVPKGELSGIKISLAENDAFSRAGITRHYFLTRLDFETIRKADGSAIVRVTSREPIREPYLDFLIKIIWPKGNMVKEYTVLLDPPVTTNRRPQAVTQATTPRTSNQGTARSASSSTAPRPMQPGSDQYGPVMANETMWGIADSLRPSGVTVHQMMMALQEANPAAFINNNINLLKKGAILRVPERSELLAVNQQQASTDFRQQNENWLAGVDAPTRTTVTSSPSEISAPAAEDSGAHLRIASTETGDIGGGGSEQMEGAEGTGDDLIAAREDAETSRQNAEMLGGEVGDLRDQVADLKRLLALKDEQLAQLQVNIAEEDVVVDVMDPQEAMAAEDAEAETAEMDETDSVVAEPEELEIVSEPEMVSEPEVVEQEAEEPEAVMEAEAVAEPAPAMVMDKEEPGWLNDNLPVVLALGFGGLLGIGGLFAFTRRNKFEEEPWSETKREMEESMLMPDTQDVESVLSEIVDVDDGDHADTSFLSEYSTEDLHALQEDTSDADPLAEADVYVAYGRYQQAQELLEAALEEQPDRAALKYKMLEIYYATQNKKAFYALAQQMVDAGQDRSDLPAWEQVTVMGRDLDPSNALFVTGGGGAGDTETMNLSELASELDSNIEEDSEVMESLQTIEIGGSSEMAENSHDMGQLGVLGSADAGGEDTELHTELQDASVLTEFAESEVLDDELADLEGDLDELMEEMEESADEQDSFGLDAISEGIGDIGSDASDSQSAGMSEFTEPTTEIEVETKLELAQAYLDMGDKDGAREIISEIILEGTDEQTEKAKVLQASFDS